MATLQSRVEGYVGTITDTASLTEWLRAGCVFVANIIPEARAIKVAWAPYDNFDLTDGRLVWCTRDGYKVRIVLEELAPLITNSASIHLARTDDPAGFVRGTGITIYPVGGTRVFYCVPYFTGGSTGTEWKISYSDEFPVGWPYDMQHGVVLYAALQSAIKSLNLDRTSFNTIVTSIIANPLSLTFNTDDSTVGSWPIIPAIPSFTYVTVSAESVVGTVIGSMPAIPEYTPMDPDILTNLTADLVEISTQLTAEDIELSNAYMQKATVRLEGYQKKLLDNFNIYQANLALFQGELQKMVEQARITLEDLYKDAARADTIAEQNAVRKLQGEIQAYSLSLQRYQARLETAVKATDVTISVFRANTEAKVGTLQALASSFQASAKTFEATQLLFNTHMKYLSEVTG